MPNTKQPISEQGGKMMEDSEIQAQIKVLRQFKTGSWGTFLLPDGDCAIRTAHIDHMISSLEKKLEATEVSNDTE